MVDREVLGEAGVKEVEREERESSRLAPPPPGGVIGLARVQMASMWSSGR